VDVAVLGGGNAGLCAALSARQSGASVIVIEGAPMEFRGGNSRHTRNVRCVHRYTDDFYTGEYSYDELWQDLGGVGDGPSDEELAAFYSANRDFFAGPGRVRVRQVFVRVSAPTDPAALARAEEAARRVRAGESIAAVAAELGDPPLSPLPDTALPPAKLRDYLGPTALRAALELDPGAVSDPVRSGTGYHVLQVVERQADDLPALDDIKPQVLAEFHRRAGERALRAYLDQLRGGATIVVADPLP